MKLYILRHAIAGEHDESKYPDDNLRPLTKKGQKKMIRGAEGLKSLGVEIDLILSSPFTRALETAKIVVDAFGLKNKQLAFSENLTRPDTLDALVAEINEKYMVGNLMLVGHEPYLSSLVSVLLTGDLSASIIFKKGGICCLDVSELVYGRCATLEWLLWPSQLVKMG